MSEEHEESLDKQKASIEQYIRENHPEWELMPMVHVLSIDHDFGKGDYIGYTSVHTTEARRVGSTGEDRRRMGTGRSLRSGRVALQH